uniref:Uncharacterized protein LOC105117248 n=1 Tax=Rhizophora mucronata TaxID=61149 RepID=A0A2P2IH71_RHIMU
MAVTSPPSSAACLRTVEHTRFLSSKTPFDHRCFPAANQPLTVVSMAPTKKVPKSFIIYIFM